MAIECHGSTVVVPRWAAAAYYPGGTDALIDEHPGESSAVDGQLIAVSFEIIDHADGYIELLNDLAGLTPVRDGEWHELALVLEGRGVPQPCPWLSVTVASGATVVAAADADASDQLAVSVPAKPGRLRRQSCHSYCRQLYEEKRRGHEEAALQTARWWTAAWPDKAWAWNELGVLLMESHLAQQGVQALRKALELNPHEPNVLANLGGALLEIEDVQGALDMLRAAVADRPSDGVAWLQLSWAQRAAGDRKNAQMSLSHAYYWAEQVGDEPLMRVADAEQAQVTRELNEVR